MHLSRLPRIWLATVTLSVLTGCASNSSDAATPAASTASDADLLARVRNALDSCDAQAVNESIGAILRDEDAADIVLYLAEQWEAGSAGDKWSCVRRPLVRAYLANTLAQAYGNKIVLGVNIQSIREALREGVASTTDEVASLSITGLDYVAEPADLRLFEQIAMGKNTFRRGDALTALSSQCSDEAASTLDRLERALSDANVAEVRKKFAFMKEARCRQRGA